MDFLLESEIVVGLVGLLISAMLIYVGLRLAQSRVWLAGVAALALTLILVAVGFWVETDREQIRRSMNEIAIALRDNNHERVFSYFHPNATAGILQVKTELPQYTFKSARVTRVIDVSVNSSTQPPTAVSEFIASVKVMLNNPSLYDGPRDARRFIKVYWMKKNDRWLVRDYEHFDVMQAFREMP